MLYFGTENELLSVFFYFKEEFMLKRLLLGLLMVVLCGGAAFAGAMDTASYISDGDGDIEGRFTDVTNIDFFGLIGNEALLQSKLDNNGFGGVDKLFTALGILGEKAYVGYVVYDIVSSGTPEYKLKPGESIFDFVTGNFYTNSTNNPEFISIGLSSPYVDPSPTRSPSDGGIIVIKSKGDDDCGGCSALQISSIVLFLLPALALVRRGKK